MARLVLIDTADQLPGLLPLHAWSALMSSELVLVGSGDHPFLEHLELADLRHEVLPPADDGAALSRADLLTGLSPADKRRAEHVVDRAAEIGEVAYLFGPSDAEAFTRTLGMEAARAGVEVEVVYFGLAPKGTALLDLVRVEERLLAPDGCPWDREQTHASLARYAVEELYELLDAISSGEPDAIREELGDVLLQVVFHAQIADSAGQFTIDDVARGIVEKLVRRHPHVFADVEVDSAEEVVANWDELKAAEKPERQGYFDGIATGQPALSYMQQLQSRASKAGFEPDDERGVAAVVRARLDRYLESGADEGAEELGALLATVISLGRQRRLDAETSLRAAASGFRARFEAMAAAADRPLSELTDEQWQTLWDAAGAQQSPPGG
ncbi:MAG TPA: nucleoside triphosphate pyrophosphohydrolase [Egibacteraceae bacterium]|nr:nucleoside triphosphate pyrophosphohydrolase [Egibacteraceae bacterium]